MKEPMDYSNYEEEDFSIFNIHSLIHFAKNNVLQISLLLLVFGIIYAVDYVTYFNMMMMSMQEQQMMKEHMKQMKKGKKGKNIK